MSSTASAKYGNYHVQSGEDIAKLVANRKLSAADFNFSQTQGFDLSSVRIVGRFRIGIDDTDYEEFSSESIQDGVLKYSLAEYCSYIEFDEILNASSVEASVANGEEIVKVPFEKSDSNKWTCFDECPRLELPVDILINGAKLFTIEYDEN